MRKLASLILSLVIASFAMADYNYQAQVAFAFHSTPVVQSECNCVNGGQCICVNGSCSCVPAQTQVTQYVNPSPVYYPSVPMYHQGTPIFHAYTPQYAPVQASSQYLPLISAPVCTGGNCSR